MSERIRLSLEVPGLRLHYEGDAGIYEETLRDAVAPLAAGRWRGEGRLEASPPGPAAPDRRAAPEVSREGPPASARPEPPEASSPPPPSSPAPAPAPARPAPAAGSPVGPGPAPGTAASWDPRPLYARLAAEKSRRSERDAVLAALVSMAGEGKRDAAAGEVLDHLARHGYPTKGMKPKPILQKLAHRTTFVVPGLLPATFRATPAGSAHVWKRSKE